MVTGDTTVRWQLTVSLWPGRDLEEVGVAARDPGQLRVTPPGDLCLRNPFLAAVVVGPSSEEQRTTVPFFPWTLGGIPEASSILHQRLPGGREVASEAPRALPSPNYEARREKEPARKKIWMKSLFWWLQWKLLIPIRWCSSTCHRGNPASPAV